MPSCCPCGVTVACCPGVTLPRTLYYTLTDLGGCPCLDGLTGQLTLQPETYASWANYQKRGSQYDYCIDQYGACGADSKVIIEVECVRELHDYLEWSVDIIIGYDQSSPCDHTGASVCRQSNDFNEAVTVVGCSPLHLRYRAAFQDFAGCPPWILAGCNGSGRIIQADITQ